MFNWLKCGVNYVQDFFGIESGGEKHLRKMIEDQRERTISQKRVIRDGIAYDFCEFVSGKFCVQATRRIKPNLTALFVVEDKAVAENWRDHGVVPEGEISELLPQLQNGKWPVHQ